MRRLRVWFALIAAALGLSLVLLAAGSPRDAVWAQAQTGPADVVSVVRQGGADPVTIDVPRSPLADLGAREASPLMPKVWRGLARDLAAWPGKLSALAAPIMPAWNARAGDALLLLGAALAVYFALRLLGRRLVARGRARVGTPVAFLPRMRIALLAFVLRVTALVVAASLLYTGLDALGLLAASWDRAGAAVYAAVLEFALLSSLAGIVLAPRAGAWRLASIPDSAAVRLSRIIPLILLVFAGLRAAEGLGPAFAPGPSLGLVASTVASSAMALLLMVGLLIPVVEPSAEAAEERDIALAARRQAPRWLKLPLWAIAFAIVLSGLAGYAALSRFLAQQVVLTGAVVAVAWLLQLAVRAWTREPRAEGARVRDVLGARFGIEGSRRDQIARLTEGVLSSLLVIGAIPILMRLWGFSGAHIRDGFMALLFGMQVGSFHISLVRIVIGAVIFTAMLFATRLIQRWLRETVLKDTRLDAGAVDSIDKVAGYIGIAAGAMLAVSYAGLDVTNLAIVAGALSVGIGFGLQSIVNNFVSGLILLIERPIKVGDRIVVGTEQGFVRRISVRATEVETFDKASLIVPNSELVTGRVLNWTHRDRMGVCNVKVGASYACDPDQVLEILKSIAAAHPGVLVEPAPSAALEGFGDHALQFNLRVSVADLDKAGAVQSELRVAILKQFRAAGIEIPFNQVDVTLRDLDAVKRYLLRVAEEKAAANAGVVPGAAPS